MPTTLLVWLRPGAGGEQALWGSGRTNAVGVIVDGQGRPLATEFLDQPNPADPQGLPLHQPHHRTITRQDRVQIYEELVLDAEKRFTTSFIHRDSHPKDNRLLPLGFIDPVDDPAGFAARFGDDPTIRAMMKSTRPDGGAERDPDFGPGTDSVDYLIDLPAGTDRRGLQVRATMVYQAIPPSWLRQRFAQAPDQPGTQRLHYLTSRLQTRGTAIEDWKMRLVSTSAPVPAR